MQPPTSGATSSDGRLRRQFGSKLLILRTWMALLILRWCSTLTTFKDSKSSCRKEQTAELVEQENLLREISEDAQSSRAPLPIGPEGSSSCSKPLFNSRAPFLVPMKIFSRTPIHNKSKIQKVPTQLTFTYFSPFQTFWDRIVGLPSSQKKLVWKHVLGHYKSWPALIKQSANSKWCSLVSEVYSWAK